MTSTAKRDERRIFERFVIAGLKGDAEHITPTAQECGRRNTEPLAPITDICVIFPTLGETVPDGFEIIETTPLAYPADLNHGSLRVPSCFLCFRRGYHKPPLIDIGVLDQGRGEKPMLDSATVNTTPFGRSANVNNSSHGIFLTYRRAPPNSAPSQLVVTHICIIIASKGEIPPHTYYKIPKNLNKGLLGSEVYICYKKSLGSAKRLAYKPAVLDYFPKNEEDSDNLKLLSNVPLFCLPMGALIECWPTKCQTPERQYSTFVLTDEYNRKYYGASVTFYERYTGELSEEQLEKLGVEVPDNDKVVGVVDDTASTNDPAEQLSFHTNVSICLVSRYPFFYPFKRFLFYIHRMSLSPSTIHAVPIERYISHLMYEVSFPSLRRPRVLMQLGAEMVNFEAQDEQQLPQYGAALFEALKSLGAENMMYLILLALLEQKILIHSLRPWLLTAVAESVCTLMFPFHWQCPYVPQCPLSLAGVLHAPLPFIAGVDSRYFDLYEDPPHDVTCFDLDTQTISGSTARHEIKVSILPKKPMKRLRAALEDLNKLIQTQDFAVGQMQTKADFVRPDLEQQLQLKKKMIEIGIQEAFLKFMATLMRGYQAFLRPIVSAPKCKSATDTGNLFDIDGFLRTRDKEKQDFYRRFCSTQSFIRFIEERSFVSDKSAYNAFFDDCIQKTMMAEQTGTEVGQLLEIDTSLSSNTVFIPPPEPLMNIESGTERGFRYNGFPRKFDLNHFQMNKLNIEQSNESKQQIPIEKEIGRCAAVRTKHETRSSLMMAANGVRTQKLSWPKTLLFYAYSLWFMQLPSMLSISRNKRKTLRLAFHVLSRLESTEVIPLDQVCYRILIEMCGQYKEPHLAVRVLHAMRRSGLEQNAVTYGLYHRAVMNVEWPSPNRVRAEQIWHRLRLYLLGMTHFRNGRKFNGINSLVVGLDSVSVSDPGYHSEAVATPSSNPQIKVQIGIDEEFDDEDTSLQVAPYTITYTPLDGQSICSSEAPPTDNLHSRSTTSLDRKLTPEPTTADPLGAFHVERDENERQRSAPPEVHMSPARAKFLADHREESLFKEDLADRKYEKEKKGGGWWKGMANSPLMKMIRSQTTDHLDKRSSVSDGSGNSESAATGTIGAFVASPSLHNIVSQVKRGYDEVVREGGSSGFGAGVSSKLRLGVSSLYQEVKGLPRSTGLIGSGQLFGGEEVDGSQPVSINESEPVFQLDSGSPDTLLDEKFWTNGLFREDQSPSTSKILDVALCVATPCPHCHNMIYDEDIMAGWKEIFQKKPVTLEVDDQNMSTECPYCQIISADSKEKAGCFAPMLHINFQWKKSCRTSWYQPHVKGSNESSESPSKGEENESKPSPLTVAFISPIVLRRELETLVAQDMLSLMSKTLFESHPVLFWNLVYFMRRLALPSHLFSWIGDNVHIRCVYDRPTFHPVAPPLYISNPIYSSLNLLNSHGSRENHRKQVTSAVGESNMFKAIQALVNENRTVNDSNVILAPHFPIFRDIQFSSIDEFGRALNRCNLDDAYRKEFEHLPPRILPLLPIQDYPSPLLNRACKMIFLPLDLF